MKHGVVASQRRVISAPSFIGSTYSAVSATDHSVSVPAGAQAGDLVLVAISCRADRSFTIPAGWSFFQNGVVTGPSNSNGKKDYIFYRTLAAETEFSFTQSVAGAAALGLAVYRNAQPGTSQAYREATTANSALTGSVVLPKKQATRAVSIMTAMWVDRSAAPTGNPAVTSRGFGSFAESNGSGGQSVSFSERTPTSDEYTAGQADQSLTWPLAGSSTGHRVLLTVALFNPSAA